MHIDLDMDQIELKKNPTCLILELDISLLWGTLLDCLVQSNIFHPN